MEQQKTLPKAMADLPCRRPVWQALSSLFLDTELIDDRNWRVSLLVASPYSIEQIEQILFLEVYPVCKYNLLCVAGEWAGFDLDWLEQSILQRLTSSWRLFDRIGSGFLMRMRSSEWQATKVTLEEARKLKAGRGPVG